ncbi:MAG: Asp23/Gls24 family envelope stress response protein [Defluviitaleaceae bacterium]|nr:Asp23/Gls24 family envelope stress response protein [Defluviitaleaceae bacterium]
MAKNVKQAEVGQIQISDGVIATIAGVAAHDVAGVAFGAGNSKGNRRHFDRGVKVRLNNGEVFVTIAITARFGFKLQNVCEEIQKKVKNALETMIGMKVREVNVSVVGVLFDKPPRPAKPQNPGAKPQ